MKSLNRAFCALAILALFLTVAIAEEEIDESTLKVPEATKDQISYIERKWNSPKEKELQTVKVCFKRLKVALPADEIMRKKFVNTFTGFKEKAADKALADALKKAKLTPASLRKTFEKHRLDALTVIESLEYTERDKNALQPKVDEACKPVFEIWRTPVVYCLETLKLDLAAAADIDALAASLGELDAGVGAWAEGTKDCMAYMQAKINAEFDVKHVEYNAQADWLKKCADFKCEGYSDEDREHVRIINDYRMMMGRKVVIPHDQLCTSSRRHSEYMDKIDKLAHEIADHPDGPTHNDRALKAGFRGKVYENITIADDADKAVWRMYKAAEHHRNMLRATHNAIGVGHSGKYWTENFSPDDS
jgi:hypothetical protein